MFVAVVLLSVCVVLWLCYLWRRRRFYFFSWKFPSLQGLPFIGSALQLKSIENVLNCFASVVEEFGNRTVFGWVVQIPFLVTWEPEYAEKFLTSPDCIDKSFIFDIFTGVFGEGLLLSNSPKCISHRKMLNPAFNHNVLLSFFPIFNDATNILVQDLGKLVDRGPFNLSRFIYAFTLRTSIETTLGADRKISQDKCLEFLRHSKSVLKITFERFIYPWRLIELIFRTSSTYKPYLKSKKYLDDFFKKIISSKLADRKKDQERKILTEDITTKEDDDGIICMKKSKNIFIDQAIDMYLKNNFDWGDLFGETTTIVNAAFGTTATTLLSIFIMLAMHPEYQQRLYEEVELAFPDKDSEVHYEDLEKLVYMDMVINETFRIAATVPFISRHAGTDLYISENVTIPKGTQLCVDIFSMHRDTKIWGPNAKSFNPDNFLPANLVDKHPFAFIPFSKGSRNCIGWRFATMQLKVALAKVVRNFRLTTQFPFEDLHYVIGLAIKFKVTPLLEIHRRND